MDLILLEKVQNLGDLGDLVKVKAGYGRNYLVPQGKAAPATKENIALFETRRAELEAAAKDKLGQARHVRPAWPRWSLKLLPTRVKKATCMVPLVLVKLHQQFQRLAMKSTRAKLSWAKARSELLVSLTCCATAHGR